MSLKTYLQDLIEYAQSGEVINHVQFSMNQLKSAIELRVFNSEGGTKDINGVSAGGYSEQYKKKRAANKRQTNRKDFNITDTLANSLRLGVRKTDKGFQYFIYIDPARRDGERNTKIADYLTSQTRKKAGTGTIFAASEKELEERDRVLTSLIQSDLQQIAEKNGI